MQDEGVSPVIYAGMVKIEIRVTPEIVIKSTCNALDIERKKLESKSRKRDLVEARYIVFHILREKTANSLSNIAKVFGKDHATVLYGLKLHESMMNYPHYRRKTEAVIKAVNNYYNMESCHDEVETIKSLYIKSKF